MQFSYMYRNLGGGKIYTDFDVNLYNGCYANHL